MAAFRKKSNDMAVTALGRQLPGRFHSRQKLFQHRMSRYDLTDFDWRGIEPLLPDKSRGVPRALIRLGLTAGQAHDGQVAGELVDQFTYTIVLADNV